MVPRVIVAPRLRRLLTGLVVLAALPLLGGCGDSTQSYCSAVKGDRAMFAELIDNNDAVKLIGDLPELKELAGSAPDDLTDEWQTFVGAVQGLDEALEVAGVKPSAYHDGKPPAGLSASDRSSIAAAADRLSSSEVIAAVDGIDQQARDVCHLDLGT